MRRDDIAVADMEVDKLADMAVEKKKIADMELDKVGAGNGGRQGGGQGD